MNQYSSISKYDVDLHRLTKDKIEEVRQWRNDPKISQFMEYRDYITPEMQEAWFKRIDNDRNYYYIISYKGEDIGLINIKDYDPVVKTGESGVFIYEDKYLNTDIAYRVHLAFFDFCFDVLGMDFIRAHVRNDNKRAIRFVKFIGYSNVAEEQYLLVKADYLNNPNRLRFLNRLNRICK